MDEFFSSLIIGVMRLAYSPVGLLVGLGWIALGIRKAVVPAKADDA